jgi:response regulator NasT
MSSSEAGPPLRVVIAEDRPDPQRLLQTVLTRLGYLVAGVAPCGDVLIELCRSLRPHLVLVDLTLPGRDGLDVTRNLCDAHPAPVIIVAEFQEAAVVDRAGDCPNVMAYLVKPVTEANLGPALPLARRRFAELRRLRDEAAALRQQMDERKVIERAKGILMKRLGVDEEDAFRRMRKMASDSNRKMPEVARRVIEAGEVFRAMDGAERPGDSRNGHTSGRRAAAD